MADISQHAIENHIVNILALSLCSVMQRSTIDNFFQLLKINFFNGAIYDFYMYKESANLYLCYKDIVP